MVFMCGRSLTIGGFEWLNDCLFFVTAVCEEAERQSQTKRTGTQSKTPLFHSTQLHATEQRQHWVGGMKRGKKAIQTDLFV